MVGGLPSIDACFVASTPGRVRNLCYGFQFFCGNVVMMFVTLLSPWVICSCCLCFSSSCG